MFEPLGLRMVWRTLILIFVRTPWHLTNWYNRTIILMIAALFCFKRSYALSAVSTQPSLKPFVPVTLPTLRNVEQHQQPTLGAQLYLGVASPVYQSGAPGPGSSQAATVPGNRFAQVMTLNPTPRSFMLVRFGSKAWCLSCATFKSTQPSRLQAPSALPVPPPMAQTVDTSNVPDYA